MFKNVFMAVAVTSLVVGGTTACATRKFVRTGLGEVNGKVDSLGRSVEETQERTRRNEGKITEVDQKAMAADQKAQAAGQAAGLKTEAFVTQEKFLTQIAGRISQRQSEFGGWISARARQFQTLTHPEHLGRKFRVLIQSR